MKLSLKIVVAIAWAAALCSAQTGSTPATPTAAKAGKPAAGKAGAQKPETPKTETKKSAYVLGPLDVLQIKVWNNQNLSGLFDVRSDGMLSMPLIGEVKADGLTIQELKDLLTDPEHVGKIMVEPIVDIQVAKVNSKRYFVYGEATRPGEYPLVETTTLLDAVATFGGFKEFAKSNKIYLMRGTERHEFNYKDVSKGKHLEQNVEIQNGDRIYVP